MRVLAMSLIGCIGAWGCGAGSIRVSQPAVDEAPSGTSVQALFEAGRDTEVVTSAAGAGTRSEDVWFAAQSLLRMGLRGEALEQFRRLRDSAEAEPFKRSAEIAIARVSGQPDALQSAQAASMEFPDDPYVQFEFGIAAALQGEHGAATQAFEAALHALPTLTYAHYYSGLSYARLNDPAAAARHLEAFLKLAPSAPEREQAERMLRETRRP